MYSTFSATSPRRRLGVAIATLATAAAVALPAQAVAAPGADGKSGDAAASRAVANGHGAKERKRKRHGHSPRAAKQAPKQTAKPQTGGSSTGNAGSGGGSTRSTPPATSGPSSGKWSGGSGKSPTTTTPPATATPPATPPSSGGTNPPNPELLFTGSRIRDFALLQAAPNAITEAPDPLGSGESVLKMTVNDQDVAPVTPTDNPRAQALSPDIINQGQEFWLATKFLIPADFPTSVPGWMSLVSIYGAPFAGSSPWQVGIDGNQLSWDRNASYNWDTPWKTPLVRGQWTTILLHERFASDGFVEMWVNGAPVTFFAPGSSYNPSRHAATQHLEMKTVDSSNGGGANAAKIMQYRQAGMFQSATVYFGALKVGTTRTAVGG